MTAKIWPPELEEKILSAYEERRKKLEKSIKLSEQEKNSLNAFLLPPPESWYAIFGRGSR